MIRVLIVAVIGLCATDEVLAQAPRLPCDDLAAHPSDTQKQAPGVEQENYDIQAGRTACAEALAQYPDEGRFHYQYGRSFFYNDEYEAAMPQFERAAELGSAQGQFVLGLIVMGGYVADPDLCRAGRLWLSAARQEHLYSKIYLLQNWLDEMFEECGLGLTQDEAKELLQQAEALATWAEARDDLAQLKDVWDKD